MNCDANQQLREGRQLLFELPRKLAQYLERKIIAKRGWLESSGVWSIVYLPWSNSSAQVKIAKNAAKIWRRRGEASCGLSQGAKAAAWVRLYWCRTLVWPCKRGLLSRTIVDFLTHACFGKNVTSLVMIEMVLIKLWWDSYYFSQHRKTTQHSRTYDVLVHDSISRVHNYSYGR